SAIHRPVIKGNNRGSFTPRRSQLHRRRSQFLPASQKASRPHICVISKISYGKRLICKARPSSYVFGRDGRTETKKNSHIRSVRRAAVSANLSQKDLVYKCVHIVCRSVRRAQDSLDQADGLFITP